MYLLIKNAFFEPADKGLMTTGDEIEIVIETWRTRSMINDTYLQTQKFKSHQRKK
jgi:hypothetical protein